jgi:hypothetical protein
MRSYPATFDAPLALQHESELDEELSRGREVVDHDADVLHPLESHVLDGKEPDSDRGARRRKRSETFAPRKTNPCALRLHMGPLNRAFHRAEVTGHPPLVPPERWR